MIVLVNPTSDLFKRGETRLFQHQFFLSDVGKEWLNAAFGPAWAMPWSKNNISWVNVHQYFGDDPELMDIVYLDPVMIELFNDWDVGYFLARWDSTVSNYHIEVRYRL